MGKLAEVLRAPVRTADASAGGGWRPSPGYGHRQGSHWAWNTAFHRQPERVGSRDPKRPQDPTNLRGRSNITPNASAFVKLLEAMRSNAPGGWTDDRYEQTLRHFVGITYVAIHRLSLQMGRGEFQVFHEDPDHPEGRRAVTRHDPPSTEEHAKKGVKPYDLVQLLRNPNKQDSFGKLMYRWSQQKKLTGMALTWMVPNVFGVPYELYSIPTAVAIPQAATNPLYPEGYYRVQPIYPYGPFSTWPSATTSVGAAIPGNWMLRFSYPHPLLRYEGYSPLTAMRLHIDSLEMIDRARHYLMRRGISPSAVLNSTDAEGAEEINEDELDRLKAMFEEDHMGPENMGRLFVAYAGWKLEQWGHPPAEMGFDGSWDQLCSFILGGGFGITRPAAGMVEDASYGGLFATMKQLHLTTLEPECEDLGSELTRHVAPYFGEGLIVEVRLPRIDDHEITFSRVGSAVSAKCITKNEARKELGYPLTKEPWGGDFAGEQTIPLVQPGMIQAPPGMGDPAGTAGILESLGALEQGEMMPPELVMPGGTQGLGNNSLGPRDGMGLDMVKNLRRERLSHALNGNGRR